MADAYQHIQTETDDGVLVVTVTDTMLRDYELAKLLETEMVQAVETAETTDVILNLAHVKMMTSAALLALLGLRHAVIDRSGQLVLCNVAIPVAEVLTVSQLIVEHRNVQHQLRMESDIATAKAVLKASD